MRGLDRRLCALEGPADPMARYHAMSDEELRARMAQIDAKLEAAGVVFPPGFDKLPWGEQQAWFQRMRDELG